MTFKQLNELWNCFWFAPTSVVPLALLRTVFGVIMLCWCALMAPEVTTFYGEHAMVPGATAIRWFGDSTLDIFAVLPATDATARTVLTVTAAAAFFLTIGFLTRLSALVLFICLASFMHHCILIMHSGDTFARILAFLLIFAPSGKMLSIDALIWRALRKGRPAAPTDEYSDVLWAPWVQRLIQLEVCAVYYQSFWAKLQGETWLHGTAVYYTSRLVEFQKFSVPYLFDHMWTIQALTWGTLFVEFSMFSLIWVKELRYWVLLMALCMHVCIDWTMNIPLFEWTMIASFLAFVEGKDLHRALDFFVRRAARPVSPPVAGIGPRSQSE